MSNPEDDWSWFWSRVDRSGGPDACWPWLGEVNRKGYGQAMVTSASRAQLLALGFRAVQRVSASRVAMAMATGKIGDATTHECGNPLCVNQRHLRRRSKGEAAMKARGNGVGWTFGEEHPNSKLTEIVVREIRRRKTPGVGVRDLAAAMGLPVGSIRSALTGWEHIK